MSTQYGSTGSSPKACAVASSSAVARPSTIYSEHLHIEGVGRTVRSTGKYVKLPDNIYYKTNFYIKQSRCYAGSYKLTEFFYFRKLQWIYVIVAVASFFTVFSSIFSFIAFFVNVAFCIIWSQHMFVVVSTMPHVLSHPIWPDSLMSRSNWHIQESVEHCQLEADIRATNDEVTGTVNFDASRTSRKYLVFKYSAVSVMRTCVIISTILFVVNVTLLSYCLGFALMQSLIGRT